MSRPLNFRQIEAFHAVMLAGTTTGAAQMLRTTQPSVSRLLAQAQQASGLKLFDMERGRLRPTREAKDLFDTVKRHFVGLERIEDRVAATIGYIQSGKLKALAITGATRSAALPNVPTAAEAGLPGLTVTSWTTLAASKDVPDALIEKISADLRRVYADPSFRAGLERLGMTPVGNSPAEARDFVERERARWNKVIETEHISAG